MTQKDIPLWLAIVINMNVIIGAGLFINPAMLTKLAGPFSGLSYLADGLLILPLVLVISQLARAFPQACGGLYWYSKTAISRAAGITSGGVYFVAKSVSCAIMVLTFATYIQGFFPSLNAFSIHSIALVVLTILGLFNTLGMRFGTSVQFLFVTLKLLPIIFVLSFSYVVFNGSNFGDFSFASQFGGFASSIPVAMYALLGFEISCAIGHRVSGSQKTVSNAVLYSFLIVAALSSLFQTALFGSVGLSLAEMKTPLGGFAQVLSNVFPTIGNFARPLLNSAIMFSVLGAAYGILFANCWNGYAIGEEFERTSGKFLTYKNRHGIPVGSVFLQCAIAASALLLVGNVVTLARLAVLGSVVSYFFSSIAFLKIHESHKIKMPKFVAYMGVASALFISFYCIKDLLGSL